MCIKQFKISHTFIVFIKDAQVCVCVCTYIVIYIFISMYISKHNIIKINIVSGSNIKVELQANFWSRNSVFENDYFVGLSVLMASLSATSQTLYSCLSMKTIQNSYQKMTVVTHHVPETMFHFFLLLA